MSNIHLDYTDVVACILHDASQRLGDVYNTLSLNSDIETIRARTRTDGIALFTRVFPSFGKAFDQCLQSHRTSLSREFFSPLIDRVLDADGHVIPDPDAYCVQTLRILYYLFYKLEIPYSTDQEDEVISAFVKTENDLVQLRPFFRQLRDMVESDIKASPSPRSLYDYSGHHYHSPEQGEFVGMAKLARVIRRARCILADVFAFFNPYDIYPRNGPGALSTRERLWEKFTWTRISKRLIDIYPVDAYFVASAGHVCDRPEILSLDDSERGARVILVPKDSRGPRLISCEPHDNMWIQQGLSRAIVHHVESQRLTQFNVRFTDQRPNQLGALLGSKTGKYATLDLKEASDRVSLDLVRLLFPEWLLPFLECCRSHKTTLPDGTELSLEKFAPMGSALCFPIMALTIWSLLHAANDCADERELIYVYGDDVIVPSEYSLSAISVLESVGLRVNREKSCLQGFFRESCGLDAFKGIEVTPIRIRTGWSATPRPDAYCSWVAYANSFYDKRYLRTYEYIVGRLSALYGPIPSDGQTMSAPTLREIQNVELPPCRSRWNHALQKREFYCWTVRASSKSKSIDGWSMLLRYFSEHRSSEEDPDSRRTTKFPIEDSTSDVRQYTERSSVKFRRRWR